MNNPMYCVICGVSNDDNNSLEECPKSEYKLSHLWAQIGYVEDWFPVKREK